MTKKRIKTAGKKEDKKEEFFVKIDDPAELRRSILESSRDLIYNLQSYQKIIALQREKALLMDKFTDIPAEITLLIKRLREKLPKDVRDKDRKKAMEKLKPSPHKEVKEKKDSTGKSLLFELDSKLDEIERRLSQLSGK
jgi:hypothetical protein